MKQLTSKLQDHDMQQAPKTLVRAAKRAREIAQQTGTAVVVVRDGQLVREIPKSKSKISKNRESA